MFNLTDEEKKAFADYFEEYDSNPEQYDMSGIEEGLRSIYSNIEELASIEQAAYSYARRLCIEVAKKRGIEVDESSTFEIADVFSGIDIEVDDFDIGLYENLDDLNKWLDEKAKNMSVTEIQDLHDRFRSLQDSFTFFIGKYCPKIIERIISLNDELDEEEKEESLPKDKPDIGWDDEELDSSSSDPAVIWEYPEDPEGVQYLSLPEVEKATDEELRSFIIFLNSHDKLVLYKNNGAQFLQKLSNLNKEKKLESFYSDKDFLKDFTRIMEHDTERHVYYFHGTQSIGDAESISQQGLGLTRRSLDSTAYSELSMDEVILTERGGAFAQIGKDAYVIIDVPVDEDGHEIDVVQKRDESNQINFLPSGLQGLDGGANYIVDPKYIVGFVNKRNRKIVFNPAYYDYERFGITGRESESPNNAGEHHNVEEDIEL